VEPCLTDELVTDPVDSDEVPRIGGGALDFLAQFGDVVIYGSRKQVAGNTPNVIEQFGAGHDLSAAED
jgi:hypothetical protein